MNARVAEILNRIELIAKKLVMSVEDVILILEGKHPTHVVVQKYVEITPPVPATPPNPIISGPADASVGVVAPSVADSTASPSTPSPSIDPATHDQMAAITAQNQIAAGADIIAPHNEG